MHTGELIPASSRSLTTAPLQSVADDVRCLAHDLKNKLSVVVGFCDLLLAPSSALGDRQRASRMLVNIRAAAQDASGIANVILTPRAPAAAAVDLNALLLDEVGAISHDLLRQNINVHMERAPRLPAVHVDPIWLARTILNLTQNARDAILGQTGRCTSGVIRFRTSRPCMATPVPCVMLSVVDDGPGMDTPTLARIWDAGWTTKALPEGDRAGARGYGLASVRTFVEASGGMVDVWSEPGRGSEFTLLLPAVAARETP